jgi:hypothetical protein
MNTSSSNGHDRNEQRAETLGSAGSLTSGGNIPHQALRESQRAHARRRSTDLDYDVGRGLAAPESSAPAKRAAFPWRVATAGGLLLAVAAVWFFRSREE